jgi:cytoskeletal protein CcmA (bactofilin family)
MVNREKKQRRMEDRAEDNRSVVAPNSKFAGNIEGAEGVLVGGELTGDVRSGDLVWIAAGGRMTGDIQSPFIIIEGRLEGSITRARHVELREKASVKGDIETQRIAMAEGCAFEGRVHMSGGPAGSSSFVEKRGKA